MTSLDRLLAIAEMIINLGWAVLIALLVFIVATLIRDTVRARITSRKP